MNDHLPMVHGEGKLTLRVNVRQKTNRGTLQFILNSTYPRHRIDLKAFQHREISQDLKSFFDGFLHHVLAADLVDFACSKSTNSHRALRNKGLALFEKLIPEDLQEVLWAHRNEGLNLQIFSNETMIPWPMIALQSPKSNQNVAEGQFLCQAYKLTQWLADRQVKPVFKLQRIGLLAIEEDLPVVAKERDMILGLAGPNREVVPIEATWEGWEEAMIHGNFDAIHICCHGHPKLEKDGCVPAIGLEDGCLLMPDSICGNVRRFGTSGPLVFFNGCFSSRADRDLSDDLSWQRTLIQHGAGAVIAAQWEIEDRAAFAFARQFYDAFLGGNPFGKAIQIAREKVKQTGSSSWLAFTAYGDPHACVSPVQEQTNPLAARLPRGHFSVPDLALFCRKRLAAWHDHPLFPQGDHARLHDYYGFFWRTFCDQHSHEHQHQTLAVLTTLALVKEPVTVSMLACFSGFDRNTVLEILDQCQPLLWIEKAIDNQGPAFAFFHASASDFLLEKGRQNLGLDLHQATHRRIVNVLEMLPSTG